MSPEHEIHGPTTPTEHEQVRREVDAARDDLADTVEALAYKTDVRARTKDKAHDLQAQAVSMASDAVNKANQLRTLAAEKMPRTAGDARDHAAALQRSARERPTLIVLALGVLAFVILAAGRRQRGKDRP